MKLYTSMLRNSLIVIAGLMALTDVRAAAQSKADSAAAVQVSAVPARITQAIDETQLVRLKGHVHPLARPEFDQGAVADSQPATRILLMLQRSAAQEAALRQLLDDQQNKASANFHKWLTPEQFGKQFGPSDADIQTVMDWLISHGFQNIKVSTGRTAVEFSGNVGQVRNTFHTEIHHLLVKGEEHFANVSEPQIPEALSPVVAGIRSLHNFHPKAQSRNLGTFRRTENGEVRPLFNYTDSNGTFYGVGPADFAKIYNIPPGANGSGQSIAIVGQSNINVQDVTDFRASFGLPPYAAGQLNVILNGPDPGLVSGDETESDLDVEWAGAVAPAATINFVTTQTTQTDFTFGIDGSALYIVNNNVAPILSESYGNCEAGLGTGGNLFYNGLWQQAAAEGITVVISAGDNGSAACDPTQNAANLDVATQGVAVNGLASTPFNVAMGGTDFDQANKQTTFWGTSTSTSTTPPVLASALGYIPETTWNDSCAATGASACTATVINGNAGTTLDGIDLVAGSGGPSSVYTTKPSWQTGFGDTVRDLPDVSLFSSDGQNKSFYIICESDQDPTGTGCNLTTSATSATHDFQGVGGTSAATPTFAGIMALVNQKTNQRQGVANYELYSLARTASNVCNSSTATLPNACIFYDITKGNISVACQGGSLDCSNTSTSANQYGAMATTGGGATLAFVTAPGYDLATGLGSINVANLLSNWAAPIRTTTTTNLSLSPLTPTVDNPVTVSGSVTGGVGTPSGVLVLENSVTKAPIDSTTLAANGTYSFPTTTLLPGGSYSIIAHYGGDGIFAASDSTPTAVNVTKQSSKVQVGWVAFDINGNPVAPSIAAQNLPYGSAYILRVDVGNASGTFCENLTTFAIQFICPTGKVTLLDNGAALSDFPNAQTPNATNVAALNDRGFAEDQPIQLKAGTHNLTATYPGDNSYNAQLVSNTLSVTIMPASTITAVAASPSSITSGGSVTLLAQVTTTSNGEAPCDGTANTGTVQFLNGSTPIAGTISYQGISGAASPTGASCTATLSTSLAVLYLPPSRTPRIPYIRTVPLLLLAMCLTLLLLALRWMPRHKRRVYAYAGLGAFLLLAGGFAGCGSSGGGGSNSHSDSITAKYSGDTNYAGSTSAAATVTIQ